MNLWKFLYVVCTWLSKILFAPLAMPYPYTTLRNALACAGEPILLFEHRVDMLFSAPIPLALLSSSMFWRPASTSELDVAHGYSLPSHCCEHVRDLSMKYHCCADQPFASFVAVYNL